VITFALYFAVQGGEYGTTDILEQRKRMSQYRAAIDSLQRSVDSLEALSEELRTNRALQERIAREEFGMIREGEILYRFVDPAGGEGGAATDDDRSVSKP
jgi:cell division protein FtsB